MCRMIHWKEYLITFLNDLLIHWIPLVWCVNLHTTGIQYCTISSLFSPSKWVVIDSCWLLKLWSMTMTTSEEHKFIATTLSSQHGFGYEHEKNTDSTIWLINKKTNISIKCKPTPTIDKAWWEMYNSPNYTTNYYCMTTQPRIEIWHVEQVCNILLRQPSALIPNDMGGDPTFST